ncbi:HNH endonuclease [Arthrobacter sp. RCC_34]|uniref:HNH endonuclease n=1 Tax=Arthrobacter sp. RCC_34 TaxID=3239230 RepID=UPI003523E725
MTQLVIDTYGLKCHLCGGYIMSKRSLSVDHVLPRARGGSDSLENLRPAHVSCNSSKGARISSEQRAVEDYTGFFS